MRDKQTYIKSIEARCLKKCNFIFDTSKSEDINRLYENSLDNSLEVIELKRLCKSHKIKFEELKKFYDTAKGTIYRTRKCCDVLINVTFENPYSEYKEIPEENRIKKFSNGKITTYTIAKDIEIEPSELRTELYKNGFICDGIKYVEYKRSASRARNGNTLFIMAELYDDMMRWSHIDIQFEENEIVDVTSLRAYESLTMSGIESTVHLNTRSILMIDDAVSNFTAEVSSTELDTNGKIFTATKQCKISNKIWDGQSLLDISVFKQAGYDEQGMLLLRNRFFKSCAFNTNLQKWFTDNNIDYVYDMFGSKRKASDILMITTPSSLKWLKFDYKFDTKKDCFKYWVKNAGDTFGIVKTEHASKFDNVNQLAYQYINSLPLSENDVKDLYDEYESKYIHNIRYDDKSFMQHIGINEDSNAHGMLYIDLIKVNPDILKTSEVKTWRYNQVNHYKKRLKKGKVKLAKTDYCTVVGNPFEMLQACILPSSMQKNINDMIHPLVGWQVSCKAYDNNVELAGFRSPHICSGNVVYCRNIIDSNIENYFNFTKNIAVLNSIDTDFLNRGQGNDFDSDTFEFTSNHIIVQSAKECQMFPTPVNNISASKLELRYDNSVKAEIDNKLSENKIGEIVNLSQVLNSYYWQYKNEGAADELLQDIYNDISQLSTLSQIELDRAKKGYTFDTSKCLKSIRKKSYIKKGTMLKKFKAITPETETRILDACKLWLLDTKKCTTVADAKELCKDIKYQESFLKYTLHADAGILKNRYFAEDFCIFSDDVQIRPLFFSEISQEENKFNPQHYVYKAMNCPMDMLQDIITKDKKIRKKNNEETIPMIDCLIENPIGTVNKRQCERIRSAVEEICRISVTNSSAVNKRENVFTEYLETLSKIKINQATMHHLLKLLYGKKGNSKYNYTNTRKRYMTKMLYALAPDVFISCFKKSENKKVG